MLSRSALVDCHEEVTINARWREGNSDDAAVCPARTVPGFGHVCSVLVLWRARGCLSTTRTGRGCRDRNPEDADMRTVVPSNAHSTRIPHPPFPLARALHRGGPASGRGPGPGVPRIGDARHICDGGAKLPCGAESVSDPGGVGCQPALPTCPLSHAPGSGQLLTSTGREGRSCSGRRRPVGPWPGTEHSAVAIMSPSVRARHNLLHPPPNPRSASRRTEAPARSIRACA